MWDGRTGWSEAVLQDFADPSDFDVRGGSPAMVDATHAALRARRPADRFFADSFHHSRPAA